MQLRYGYKAPVAVFLPLSLSQSARHSSLKAYTSWGSFMMVGKGQTSHLSPRRKIQRITCKSAVHQSCCRLWSCGFKRIRSEISLSALPGELPAGNWSSIFQEESPFVIGFSCNSRTCASRLEVGFPSHSLMCSPWSHR